MGIVVRLASFNERFSNRAPRSTASPHAVDRAEFTLRDRADLRDWSALGRRVSICSCEMGTFAMLYQGELRWASWGVVRREHTVLLWNCVTLIDIGRFSSMVEALDAIPVAGLRVSTSSVLLFGSEQQHGAAAN